VLALVPCSQGAVLALVPCSQGAVLALVPCSQGAVLALVPCKPPNQSSPSGDHGSGQSPEPCRFSDSGSGQSPEPCRFSDSGSGHSYKIMFYVYILQSLKYPNEIYTGYTTDLRIRFSQHQKGLVRSTKPYRPWRLIFYEAYLSKVDAKSREKYFKTAKGKRVLKLMLQDTLRRALELPKVTMIKL